MSVKAKSIRNMSRVLKVAGSEKNVRLVFSTKNVKSEVWTRIGFDAELSSGQFMIPSVVGKVTDYNVNGKEEVRKDLDKIDKSIMYSSRIKDWHGNPHDIIGSRTIKVYQRDYIPAPSCYLYIIEINGEKYISSGELILHDDQDAENIHTCNLMLECFGEFEIIDSKSEKIISPKLSQIQWEILPRGKYPWDKTKKIISPFTETIKKRDREVIEHRMRVISNFTPDFIAMGRGGFLGYFIYGFEANGIYVLESTKLDNATYVFKDNWEELSKLTKNEIINSEENFERILHNKSWQFNIRKTLRK
ncbi:hypothetical protein RJ45_05870 [Photobacterium gaetbulicola]|uniref:Uncharacterized protein n=1 Tax=Photobacterium gaetbulicola TaxID=1295392 RepID=A0A0B9H0N2_9GAMM|nr:hypothetical protein [Photobacterium gaetbulicola]KHT64541.1 hypothetical protein RJ45_05870 [Photobacterium gaetbulicola]